MAISKRWQPSDCYSQDEDGQWWYKSRSERPGRTRAKRKTCEHCGDDFFVYTSHFKKARYCSRSCSALDNEVSFHLRPKPNTSTGVRGRIMRRGYILLYRPDHPSLAGTTRTYILEHRLVMEETLGRPLERHERVHHINGDPADNRPDNLELWTRGHPNGVRARDRKHCPTCTCAVH